MTLRPTDLSPSYIFILSGDGNLDTESTISPKQYGGNLEYSPHRNINITHQATTLQLTLYIVIRP